MLPLLFTMLGLLAALFTVKALPSATFITSAQPQETRTAIAQSMTDDKLRAIIEKRKVKLGLEEVKQRITTTAVKPDEIVVSFDYNETLAARQVVVDLVQAIGDTGKAPIVALELGKKKPEASPVRIAIGMVAGFLLGFSLRQFAAARLAAAK
jgi:hypothetical protein